MDVVVAGCVDCCVFPIVIVCSGLLRFVAVVVVLCVVCCSLCVVVCCVLCVVGCCLVLLLLRVVC